MKMEISQPTRSSCFIIKTLSALWRASDIWKRHRRCSTWTLNFSDTVQLELSLKSVSCLSCSSTGKRCQSRTWWEVMAKKVATSREACTNTQSVASFYSERWRTGFTKVGFESIESCQTVDCLSYLWTNQWRSEIELRRCLAIKFSKALESFIARVVSKERTQSDWF